VDQNPGGGTPAALRYRRERGESRIGVDLPYYLHGESGPKRGEKDLLIGGGRAVPYSIRGESKLDFGKKREMLTTVRQGRRKGEEKRRVTHRRKRSGLKEGGGRSLFASRKREKRERMSLSHRDQKRNRFICTDSSGERNSYIYFAGKVWFSSPYPVHQGESGLKEGKKDPSSIVRERKVREALLFPRD